jgi:hypothetical protein
MNRIRKLRALGRADRALVLRAFITLCAVRMLLWTLPFARVRSIVARLKTAGSRSRAAAPLVRPVPEKIAWALRAASGGVPSGSNCLVRALAGEILLARAGYLPALRFGAARPDDAPLAAHAWLECDGRIVIGEFEAPGYTPFGTSTAEPL